MKKGQIFLILLLVLMSVNSCVDLEEELYSSITAETFFTNEQECLLAAGSVYSTIRYTPIIFSNYAC